MLALRRVAIMRQYAIDRKEFKRASRAFCVAEITTQPKAYWPVEGLSGSWVFRGLPRSSSILAVGSQRARDGSHNGLQGGSDAATRRHPSTETVLVQLVTPVTRIPLAHRAARFNSLARSSHGGGTRPHLSRPGAGSIAIATHFSRRAAASGLTCVASGGGRNHRPRFVSRGRYRARAVFGRAHWLAR